jgi:hypothetical protein
MPDMSTSAALAWIHAVNASIPDSVAQTSVAIIAANRPVVAQIGTGTLFRIGKHHFLVTAAHVVSLASKRRSTLGITGAADMQGIALGGQWVCSGDPDSGHSPFDVAIYKFQEKEITRLGDRLFLSLAELDPSDNLAPSILIICGYPQVWSDNPDITTMLLKPLQIVSYTYEGDTAGLADYEAASHLLMDAREDNMQDMLGGEVAFRSHSGRRMRIPDDIEGASGCSVWRLGGLYQSPHTFANARLVGVLTGVYPTRKLIKATRWNYVLNLMLTAFPDKQMKQEVERQFNASCDSTQMPRR